MATSIDGISTSSSTDAYGNAYTTAISGNDNMESEDFITLMLTELSMQDPTDPVDSSSMLDDQLSLQTLETNISLSESMESLATTFEQSALADSAALIGNIVETSGVDSDGNTIQYKVSAVEGQDGTISLTAYEITDYYDVYSFESTESIAAVVNSESEDDILSVTNSDGEVYEVSTYGKTYEEIAEEFDAIDGITASMSETSTDNYQLVISVSGAGSSISSSETQFAYSKENMTAYSGESETLSFNDITKIY